MPEQENLKLARASFDTWNAHDPERYVKLLDEKHVFESDTLPESMTGREAGRQFMKTYISAFPDLHFQIDQILAWELRCHSLDGNGNTSRAAHEHSSDKPTHYDSRLHRGEDP